MIDTIIRRVCSINRRAAAMALVRHLATMSAIELEALARAQGSELADLLRDGAATQLRIVTELPVRLEQIAAHVRADNLPVGLRLGLRAILRGVIRHAEVVPRIDSEATAMLGPAYVLHRLMAELQPWLPDSLPEPESPLTIELLHLGVPDYMRPLADGRVASSWRYFHRLRALGPDDIEPGEDLMRADDERLVTLLMQPAALAAEPPPWPGSSTASAIPSPIVDPNTFELRLGLTAP